MRLNWGFLILLIIAFSSSLSPSLASPSRELRGRYSGSRYSSSRYSGSRSSRSSYYSSTSRTTTTKTIRYQKTANTPTYTNSYFSGGKTYQPLYTYYLPKNYYNAAGYYSTLFLLTYYDGYGYNFYYGQYGYYEYSVNDVQVGALFEILESFFIIVIAVIIFVIKRRAAAQGGDDSDREYTQEVVEEKVVTETVTTTTHHEEHHQQQFQQFSMVQGPPAYPPGVTPGTAPPAYPPGCDPNQGGYVMGQQPMQPQYAQPMYP